MKHSALRWTGVALVAATMVGTAALPASAARPKPSPPPTFTTAPDDPTSATSATFTWVAPAGVNETYTCALDGGKPQNCNSGTVSYPATNQPPLTDGTHTFTLRFKAQGTGGTRYKASTRTVTWSIDTKAPDPPTVDQVTTPTSNTSASITYHVADPTTVAVACTLDSMALPTKPTTSCDDPYLVSGLSDGDHTVRVYAFDAVGNRSTPGQVTWHVDTTAPGYPVFTVQPHNPTNATTADFTWTDDDATTFACLYDGSTYTPCTSPVHLSGVTAGTHVFSVQGTDAVGNVGPAQPVSWAVDLTAPDAPVVNNGPADPTDDTTATFHFTDSDTTATFQCAVDGSAPSDYGTCSSPLLEKGPFTNGSHFFLVRAVDPAGNVSPVTEYDWSVNTTDVGPPDVSPVFFLDGPDGFTNHASVSFTWQATDDVTTGFVCTLDGVSAACPDAFDPTSGVATLTLSVSGQGVHVLAVKASDGTNLSPATTWKWTYDSVAPAAPSFSTTPPANSNTTTALFAFASEPGATLTCRLDTGGSQLCVSPLTLQALSDGEHTLTVTAADAAGNTSSTPYTWTVDTIVPPAPGVSGADPSGTTQHLVLTDGDPTAGFLCALDGATATPCTSPVTYAGLSGGSHHVVVQAKDPAGNVSDVTPYAWTVDPTAPQAPDVQSSPAGLALTNATSATFTFADNDPSVTGIQCSLDGAAGSPCVSPTTVTGLGEGAHSLAVTARNGLGNTSTTAYPWTVDLTKPTLAIADVPSGLTGGRSIAPVVTVNDAHPKAPTCTLAGPTPATTCGPFTNLSDGAYTFTVNDTDLAGNTATPVVLRWTVDGTAPTATSFTAPTSLVGPATLHLSETVAGISGGGVSLALAGSNSSLAVARRCLSGGAVVACTGSVDAVQLVPTSPLVPGQRYAVRMTAGAFLDAAGNASTAASYPFVASTSEQESSQAAHGSWQRVRTSSALGGSYVREHRTGASAAWSFRGSSVTWWTLTGPTQGKAAVVVDGARRATVDNYSRTTQMRVARRITGLRNGAHTLVIRVLGVKGARAGRGTFVAIDGFTAGGRRTRTPALTATWPTASSARFSGRHAAVADLRGESVSFVFRGTRITWVTMRGRGQGRVAVWVDGRLRATVDNFARTASFGVRRTVSGLADTVHTLKLVVLGTHHRGATGSAVTLDRYVVG